MNLKFNTFTEIPLITFKCSTTCGEGQRRRTLFCKTSEGKVVEDKLCHGKPKPPEKEFTERCKNQPCPIQNFTENNSVHRDYNLTYRRRSKFPQKWKSYGHEYVSSNLLNSLAKMFILN